MTNKRGMFTKSTKSIIDRNKVVSMSDFLDESKEDDNIYYIPVNEIQDNPFQPRKHFDEKKLQELSNSIKQSGVIQPIVVRQENELVILVAGERRLRASKLAGLEKIPAIISKGNPIEISLIENIQRENLEPFEEAEALKKMIDEYDYTQEKLALVVSKSQTIISRSLSLNKIPEELRLKYAHAHISKRSLIEVAKQKTFDLMSGLFEKIILGNLKSDEVREITKKQNKKEETKEKIAFKKAKSFNKFLSNISSEIDKENYSDFLQEIYELKERIEKFLK